jgi:hypothetical protein
MSGAGNPTKSAPVLSAQRGMMGRPELMLFFVAVVLGIAALAM